MPVWHEATKEARASGRLAVVGITQEQHPERCRLFAAWHDIEWPILWDPFNLTGSRVVPNFTLLDEDGRIVAKRARPQMLAAFLGRPRQESRLEEIDRADMRRLIQAVAAEPGSQDAAYWNLLSDLLWRRAVFASEDLGPETMRTDQGAAHVFRRGVALRMRYDSRNARRGDFQAAIDAWQRALAAEPGQYIWRRRIQQYGPRLDKPYPFYGWMAEAEADLRARGHDVPAQPVPLTRSERASPAEAVVVDAPNVDVTGLPEVKGLLQVEATWVPHTGPDRQDGVVHLVLRDVAEGDERPDRSDAHTVIALQQPARQDLRPTGERGLWEDAWRYELPLAAFPAEGRIAGEVIVNTCRQSDGVCRSVRQAFSLTLERRE